MPAYYTLLRCCVQSFCGSVRCALPAGAPQTSCHLIRLSLCLSDHYSHRSCLYIVQLGVLEIPDVVHVVGVDSMGPHVGCPHSCQERQAARSTTHGGPVVTLVLIGHMAVIGRMFFVGDEDLRDAELYRGIIWDRELVVRAIPFYVSRVATLSMWCPRLIWRLSTASKSEVTIIRGACATTTTSRSTGADVRVRVQPKGYRAQGCSGHSVALALHLRKYPIERLRLVQLQ